MCLVPAAGAAGFRGYLAVAGDRVVAEENADRLFTPASVEKLLVVTAALHHLGDEHRIVTRVRATGPIEAGELRGDLVLVAAGDPTWSTTFHPDDPEVPLVTLAAEIRARGVRRVTGDLVIDTSAFPGRRFHPDLPLAELGVHVGAPTAAIALEENLFTVEVRAGSRVGAPGYAQTVEPFEIENRIVTVGGDRHGRGSVEFLPTWGRPHVVVRGEYPVSEGSYRVRVAVPAPEAWIGAKLRGHLAAAGVELAGAVVVSSEPWAASGEVVASYTTPLVDVLEPILKNSSNWQAAMLLQRLALEVTGSGRLDDGMEVVEQFLSDTLSLDAGGFALRDASGLSPYNLVSPRVVVAVLRHALEAKWGGSLVDRLASNGTGTLAAWPAMPALAAKTGTIRNSTGLAGILHRPGQEPIAFAIFLDNDIRPLGERRSEIAGLLRRWARPG